MVCGAVLGSNGFIGSNLRRDLSYLGITKDNYTDHTGKHFDVLINANGNSNKRLPEKDPLTDFDLTVRNTLKSVIDFKYDLYIYISSCESGSRYALSKHLAECIVKQYCSKWLILKLNGPIGPEMKKGPIYDIMTGQHLWISAESKFQLIHTSYISELINTLIKNDINNQTMNVTGRLPVSLREAMTILGKRVDYPSEPVITHDFDIDKANSYLPILSSIESLRKL